MTFQGLFYIGRTGEYYGAWSPYEDVMKLMSHLFIDHLVACHDIGSNWSMGFYCREHKCNASKAKWISIYTLINHNPNDSS